MAAPAGSPADRQRGFALLVVLWTLMLIAFLVAQLTGAGRTEIRIADNLAANAAVAAAADGAIYQAIFVLSDSQPERRPALDGTVHDVRIGRSTVALRLENQAARVNPNMASPALVEALLRIVSGDPQRSADLADAIAEWVGRPRRSLHAQAPAVAYQALKLDYRPPGAPLESIDELAQIRGMTPDLLAALRPHVTLFGPADPDPAAADPEVAAALALMDPLALRAGALPSGVADLFVRIRAIAQGPGNALVTRNAVARIGPTLTRGYALLAWDSGDE